MSEEKKKESGRAPLIITAVVLVVCIIAVVAALGIREHRRKNGGDKVATADTAEQALAAGIFTEYAKGRVLKTGDYKNFSYGKYVYEVTDEMIKETYAELVKTYSEAGMKAYEQDPDRTDEIKDGDTVNIDYTGYLDGVAFDRGSDKGFNLTVGSGSFLEEFEKGLIGHKPGESFEIPATFPENYSLSTELAGKSVVFSVKVNFICREIPLTTENAYKELFYMETLDEMYDYLRKYLTENPTQTAESYMENIKATYVQQILDGSEFGDISADVDARYKRVLSLYEDYAKQQNTTVEQLVTGGLGFDSMESFEKKFRQASEVQARNELVFAVIGDAENIKMTDSEYETLALSYAKSAGYEDLKSYEEEYAATYGSGTLKNYVYTIFVQEKLFSQYAKQEN